MKKIMFNDRYGLTRAVLEGRKTMTRRIVPECKELDILRHWEHNEGAIATGYEEHTHSFRIDYCPDKKRRISIDHLNLIPSYKVGEVVAVAEAYQDSLSPLDWINRLIYQDEPGWKNKMFVRAELMPHQIRITNIRVERLQDISEEDCCREGIWKDNEGGRVIGFPFGVPFYYTFDGAVRDGKQLHWTTPKEAFSALIDKVSGKGTWQSNPWVFVYEFELVK